MFVLHKIHEQPSYLGLTVGRTLVIICITFIYLSVQFHLRLQFGRLGHLMVLCGTNICVMCLISVLTLEALIRSDALSQNSPDPSHKSCTGCKLAKFAALSFPTNTYVSLALFDLAHSDIWSPTLVLPCSSFLYYASFIDDY